MILFSLVKTDFMSVYMQFTIWPMDGTILHIWEKPIYTEEFQVDIYYIITYVHTIMIFFK